METGLHLLLKVLYFGSSVCAAKQRLHSYLSQLTASQPNSQK